MSAQIARRSTLMLYLAMALAVGCGLSVLPPLDPLAPLRERPWASSLLPAALHLALASLGAHICRCTILRQGDAKEYGRGLQWLCAGAVAAAWLWWLGTWRYDEQADARALLWLEMLPLWLWPAGLRGQSAMSVLRHANSTRAKPAFLSTGLQALQYGVEDSGLLEQVDMTGPRHRQDFAAGPDRAPRGEHNAVARAEDTQHGGRA